MICDDQPDARRGTTSSKRSVVEAQLRLDNKQQDTDRRRAGAAQHQAQQEADKDKMIVDPPSSNEGGKDSSSATGVQGCVASSGKDAVPATAAHKPTTMGTNRVVARVVSSGIVQSPKGKTAGQGLDGNYGSSSQSHRQAQVQKRQKRLTDRFMIKIPNHQHVGNLARKAHAPIPAPQPRKKCRQNTSSCSRWVCHSFRNKQGKTDCALSGKSVTEVVISGPFMKNFPCNHSVNINIIIFFFRRSKRQRNFSLFYFASQES
jgi:hypothetical protein